MLVWLLFACSPSEPVDTNRAEVVSERPSPPPTILAERPDTLIAIGDVHGDFRQTKSVLRMAGVIDFNERWVAGNATVVQTGDQLDRGDGEEQILELFEDLADQAHAAGGAFYSLLGNHEVMNVELDLRYVTEGGFEDFADTPYDDSDAFYEEYEANERGRVAAFRPGGEWAKVLSNHNVVMQIGDTLFVHGGILPEHVDYGLNRINKETRQWMRDKGVFPSILNGDDSPIWTRIYSDDDAEPDCARLEETLGKANASYMVVGHTVWDTINPACDGKLWRVDVGMSAYYGGAVQALKMEGEDLSVLAE